LWFYDFCFVLYWGTNKMLIIRILLMRFITRRHYCWQSVTLERVLSWYVCLETSFNSCCSIIYKGHKWSLIYNTSNCISKGKQCNRWFISSDLFTEWFNHGEWCMIHDRSHWVVQFNNSDQVTQSDVITASDPWFTTDHINKQ